MPEEILIYAGLSALLKFFVYFRHGNVTKPKTEDEVKEKIMIGSVKELAFFPLKSARPINVNEINCIKTGFTIGMLGDRGLAIMTPRGHAITAMREPTVTVIVTRVKDNIVELEAPGLDMLAIDLKKVEKMGVIKNAKFMGTSAEVYDCGDEAGEWISDFLNKAGHRIVFCGPGLGRRVSKDCIASNAKLARLEFTEDFLSTIPYAELTLSNSSPVNLVSQESLDDTDEKLPRPVGAGHRNCPMTGSLRPNPNPQLRFRSNIVVEGVPKPYDEDTWDDIYINNLHIKFARLNGRCSMSDTDPETGLREKGPCTTTKCMKEWRALFKTKRASYVFLCIHCTVEKPGSVKIGDPVYVTKQPIRELVPLKE